MIFLFAICGRARRAPTMDGTLFLEYAYHQKTRGHKNRVPKDSHRIRCSPKGLHRILRLNCFWIFMYEKSLLAVLRTDFIHK